MHIVIIIPTYNEFENITKMIPYLYGIFLRSPNHKFSVLVVDGNSPDGTADLVKTQKKLYPFVDVLLEEKKAGIGAAYVQAFKYVMANYDADYVVEMDSDFQHDPNELQKFVGEMEKGADYIIGSRFTAGGSIPKEWAFHRKFLSKGGNLFTKIVLNLYSLNDFTSGFKATRVKGVLDKLDLENIKSTSFAYKVDLLYKVHKLGAKIVEVPIKFGMRDDGASKIEHNTAFDTLKVVVLLRLEEHKSFVKFCIVGFTGLFTDSILFNILRLTLVGSTFASAIAGLVAMIVTFKLNNRWSFGDRKKTSISQIKTFPAYALTSYIPIIFRSWFVTYIISIFGDTFISANSAFLFGVLVGLVWNFTIYSKIIWKKYV